MRRLVLVLFFLLIVSGVSAGDVPPEYPAAVVTSDGSRILGMLSSDRAVVLRESGGKRQNVDLSKLKSITIGERLDPNLENEALLAVDGLRSDQFEVRDKAESKLRSLGRAAAKPLAKAAASQDNEEATRARALLSELNIKNADESCSDTVVTTEGGVSTGELANTAFLLRSRWGNLRLPVQMIESIEFLKPEQLNGKQLVPPEQPVIVLQRDSSSDSRPLAQRWDPNAQRVESPAAAPAELASGALSGARHLSMTRVPDPASVGEDGRPTRVVPVKVGDPLEDAYSLWGALLRPTEANGRIEAAADNAFGANGVSAKVSGADCEIQFVIPGSYHARNGTGREGGVSTVGAVINVQEPGTIGLATFDRSGRQIARVLNTGDSKLHQPAEVLAVRARVPIVRARLFRAGAAKAGDLILREIFFDRIVDPLRQPEQAYVWLSGGERLSGKLSSEKEKEKLLTLQLQFLEKTAPAVSFTMDDIDKFEAPRTQQEPKKRPVYWFAHGILLQNGDTFSARLMKLDEKEATFLLPGGAELKLPRRLLRKVELYPPHTEPGEPAPPTALSAGEKPGVDFVNRDDDKNGAKPEKGKPDGDEKKPKNPDVLHTTQRMERIDNAEVIGLNMEEHELTIRDDNGEWTIGSALAKTLVFAENEDATKAQPRFRDWLLTLREGSCFELSITAITADGIQAEMAGGTVFLPLDVVDTLERHKR